MSGPAHKTCVLITLILYLTTLLLFTGASTKNFCIFSPSSVGFTRSFFLFLSFSLSLSFSLPFCYSHTLPIVSFSCLVSFYVSSLNPSYIHIHTMDPLSLSLFPFFSSLPMCDFLLPSFRSVPFPLMLLFFHSSSWWCSFSLFPYPRVYIISCILLLSPLLSLASSFTAIRPLLLLPSPFLFEQINLRKSQAQELDDILVDAGHPILSDILTDRSERHLYTASAYKVSFFLSLIHTHKHKKVTRVTPSPKWRFSLCPCVLIFLALYRSTSSSLFLHSSHEQSQHWTSNCVT